MTSIKEQVRKAIFGKLKTLRRKLNAQNIPCTYSRSVLSHENGEIGYKITYHVANNGDMTILPKLSLRTGRIVEEFDSSNFEQGLARLREVFDADADRDDV